MVGPTNNEHIDRDQNLKAASKTKNTLEFCHCDVEVSGSGTLKLKVHLTLIINRKTDGIWPA